MGTSRVRKPSRLAREIAGTDQEPGAEQPKKSAKGKGKGQNKARRYHEADDDEASATPQPTATANVKAGGKRGRAVLNANGEVDIEEAGEQLPPMDEDEDEDQLWCICLGRDDHRPMIQCEGCENWFHFECIKLDPAEAQFIEAFYCDLCEESGNGSTRRMDPAAIAAKQKQKPKQKAQKAKAKARPIIEYKTDSGQDDGPELLDEDDNDDSAADPDASGASDSHGSSTSASDSEDEGLARSRARRMNTASGAAVYRRTGGSLSAKKKKRRAEGMSSDETDSDEEFTGDGRNKKRKVSNVTETKPPTHRRQSSTTIAAPAPSSGSKVNVATTAGVEKTRKACVDQFSHTFRAAFAAAGADAATFAAAVEAELFESYAEADTQGVLLPKSKYLGRFRSLLFNIKNNPEFLTGLPTAGVAPDRLAHMSNEDLQTPEQRALAEQVRQRSLKDSVKTVAEAPRVKHTHKGEEAIDTFDSHDVERAVKEEAARAQRDTELRRIEEEQMATDLHRSSPAQHSPTLRRPTVEALKLRRASTSRSTDELVEEPAEMDDPEDKPPGSARPSVNFNFDNVWGAMRPNDSPTLTSDAKLGSDAKKVPKDDDDMDTDASSASSDADYEPQLDADEPPTTQAADGDGPALPDNYDPFASMEGDADGEDTLDNIIRGDEPATAEIMHAEPEKPPTSSLPRLWSGNIMTAEEGGFAGQAVQVGGRPLGTSQALWEQLFLGDTLNVVGRLPIQKSVEYLVQSHFAKTRELVIVELLPNLSNVPPLPPPDRVNVHRQRFIDAFATKQRHAVVSVKDPKRIVKDIYIVPLPKDAPLPEFVELLDDHMLSETGRRDSDTLLAALIIQKDVFPTVRPAAQTAPPPVTSVAPVGPPGAMPAFSPTMAAPQTFSLPPGMSPPLGAPPIPASVGGAPRPPPGFVPFVPPAAPAAPLDRPSAPGSLDYAALDIPAIKSLLANGSTFRSLLDAAPHVAPALARNPNLMAALQSDPSLMPQLAMFPVLLNALLGAGASGRGGGSPPGPGPARLPPSPRTDRPPPSDWGRSPPHRGGDWGRRSPPPRDHRRTGSGGGRWDEPPRGGGGSGRGRREDFVAPARDGGWGGRGGRPGDQYSMPVYGGGHGR